MKSLRILTVWLCLALFCFSSVTAQQTNPTHATKADGPLGFYPGETRSEIIAAVGSGAIRKQHGDSLELATAPKPYAAFESYILVISPKDGLLKVVCIGKNIDNDSYGTELRESFETLQKAITNQYGTPSNTYDFLGPDSIWNDPNDFMMGLAKKDRTLATFWGDAGQVRKVESIELEAKSLDSTTGFIALSYEFTGFVAYADAKKAADSSVL